MTSKHPERNSPLQGCLLLTLHKIHPASWLLLLHSWARIPAESSWHLSPQRQCLPEIPGMLSLPVGGESQAKRPLGSCLHGSMPLLDANGVWPGMRPKRWVAPLPPASGYHGCLVLHLLLQLQDPSSDIRIGQGHSPTGHFVIFFSFYFIPHM